MAVTRSLPADARAHRSDTREAALGEELVRALDELRDGPPPLAHREAHLTLDRGLQVDLAAVAGKHLGRYMPSVRSGEPGHDRADVLRRPVVEAVADRARVTAERAGRHARAGTRRDRVHRDTDALELARHRHRHADDAGLRRRVVDLTGHAEVPGFAARVDDAAVDGTVARLGLRPPIGRCEPGRREVALQVHMDDG